ncbi:MAG TPA: hypothetical protein V6D17_22690, partial [Candidatus Obscuribacterales bacterium]
MAKTARKHEHRLAARKRGRRIASGGLRYLLSAPAPVTKPYSKASQTAIQSSFASGNAGMYPTESLIRAGVFRYYA